MPAVDVYFLRIAVVYLLTGLCLGVGMGASGDHSLFPAHAHINLVGWVSFTLYAGLYRAFPAMASSRLAAWHFWLANLGALSLCLGIAGITAGYPEHFRPFAASGGIATLASALCLAANVFRNTGTVRETYGLAGNRR